MNSTELNDIAAMLKRRVANDKDVLAAEIGLKLIAKIEALRVELERERLKNIRLTGRLNGMGLL